MRKNGQAERVQASKEGVEVSGDREIKKDMRASRSNELLRGLHQALRMWRCHLKGALTMDWLELSRNREVQGKGGTICAGSQ
jgi:hypothetical protein